MKREQELQRRRWLKALEIAKACFYFEGYHTRYLEEIENYIRDEAREYPRKTRRERIWDWMSAK